MALGPSGEIPIKEFQNVLARLGIFLHNYENGESFADDFWFKCGYSEEDMEDLNWFDLLHPDDREKAEEAMKSIRNNQTDKFDLIYRVRTVMGDYRWVYNSGTFLSRDKYGNPALFLGTDRDITALKETEQKLSEALITAKKRAYELETLQIAGKSVTSLLELKQTLDIILHQAKKVIPFSTASIQLLKDDGLDIIGSMGWDSLCLTKQKTIPLSSKSPNALVIEQKKTLLLHNLKDFDLQECVHNEISSWIGVPLIINDKILGLLSCNGYAVERFNENHLHLAAGFGDYVAIAINNAQNHENLIQLAFTDPLTAIQNRRSFFEEGERLFFQAKRYHWPLSFLMIDLDNFKTINDQYGHNIGDDALVAASAIFKDTIRKSDLLCRYGGDEFCIILPETDLETTKSIAERILIKIRELQLPDGAKTITVSIGIALWDSFKDETFEEAMTRADKALYSAKDQLKDCWINL